MTFAAGDMHELPIYGGRFRFTFPFLNTLGVPVTGASAPDSNYTLDCGTLTACVNEAVEIASASKLYYLDLVAAETSGANVSGIINTSSSGVDSTVFSFKIRRWPILESGTAQAGAASTITFASTASAKDGFYNGLYVQCSNNTPSNVQGMTRPIISYVGSTKVATLASAWGTNPSSATTYDILLPLTVNLSAILCQRMPDWATAGVPKVDSSYQSGTALTARDIGASVLLSSGSGAGQLDFTSGVVKSSLVQILGNAIAGTAAQISASFTKFFDKATPTGTVNSLPDAVAGAAGGVFIAGANAATSVTTAFTANVTGNVSGSVSSVTGAVGSVTGAVGSVTGNVGGNVVGTVGTVNAMAANSLTAAAAASDLSTEIAAAVMASVIEGTITLLQAQRVQLAAAGGKVSGAATTTVTIRDTTDAKSRVIATVDADGNRSAVTLDVT